MHPDDDEQQQEEPETAFDAYAEAKGLSQQIMDRFGWQTVFQDVSLSGQTLKPMIDALTSKKILVEKGIITEAEWDVANAATLADLLRHALQTLEELQLQQPKGPALALPDGYGQRRPFANGHKRRGGTLD